ncbi:hypothetical protein SKAU_G00030190 [Synaphobranchus kaupii]|uniref:Fibronectin type-III domain-containing protein n=1 Tax=Synaphobranchus kaupii TaxID=118154 RepID=A0A9Q1JD34_SYNKA|nr:hypothetical protein SKAU_G00030190 [Synaphobranchus kaupii]
MAEAVQARAALWGTLGVMSRFPWCLAVVFACVTLFTSGSEVLHCNMTVMWKDLRGLLQWDCPVHSPNTTFTVQKKTQGEPQWQAVGGCNRVTSRSCDISQAFTEFHLYNWIRLGQEDAQGSVKWSEPSMCDPLAEMVYSPPSLSVSLRGSNLTVNVTLACWPIGACPQRDCCPLSELILDLCTSITVYSETRPSRHQTYQKCGAEEKVSYEFRGLVPGQRYCAVANFTQSPVSSPLCVDLPSQTEFLRPLWLLGAVLFMLFATIPVIYCLRQQWTSAETRLPRALRSLQNGESVELRVPCEDFQEDCEGDHLSVLSLSLSESRSVLTLLPPPEAQTVSPSQGEGYCSNPLPVDTGSGQIAWDSGGMGGGLELSGIPLLFQCVVAPDLSQELRGSPPQIHTGPAGMVPAPLKLPPPLDGLRGFGVARDVPLRSVKLGTCEEDELEGLWFDLNNPSLGGT